MISAMEQRVRHYWTLRSHDFGAVRKNELENEMGQKWLREIERLLPEKEHLRILDVGTGTGFFAVLLAQAGHQVEGIDLTPAMLEEARLLAAQRNLDIVFREMDAQALSYAEESFDVVLSRNLTWTLPEPEKAYREWFRVLKPGGWLLNFDADYAANVRSRMQNCKVAPDSPYGHIGMTDALQQENDEITLTMDIGQLRPAWDMRVLRRIGFSDCRSDATTAGGARSWRRPGSTRSGRSQRKSPPSGNGWRRQSRSARSSSPGLPRRKSPRSWGNDEPGREVAAGMGLLPGGEWQAAVQPALQGLCPSLQAELPGGGIGLPALPVPACEKRRG